MFRLVKDFGKVFFGLADVFGNHQREVHFVDRPPRGVAQQAGGHRLAGSRRTVKQTAVAGSKLGSHAPIIHERDTMAHPRFDFLNLFASAGMQHKIAPT